MKKQLSQSYDLPMDHFWDLQRFIKLFRLELSLTFKPWIISSIVIVSCALLINLMVFTLSRILVGLQTQSTPQTIIHIFPSIIFLVGVILVSFVFSSFNDNEKAINHVMLPASMEEKFLLRLLLSTVGYLTVNLVLISLVSVPIGALYNWAWDTSFAVYNPFRGNFGLKIGLYFLFHSLFFAGALFWRGVTFFKTCLVIFSGLLAVFSVILMLILLNGHEFILTLSEFWRHPVTAAVRIALLILVPIMLYTWTYFRLKKWQLTR
ncbi:hypothetical protein CHISP_3175 [Chitinispirillum alkaliphilum]|nr:hypothetical protein CHISP_3175 [Chitinispirillum alkaliphilum]